ncbi:MAG: sodium/proline symporter [Alphaproteobacteria bacterium]|nr:sodium/proline symporter [Alphaproteobacteria bacterium]
MVLSFFVFLAAFLCIGLLSIRKKQNTADDYLLAGRNVSPAFVGLSGAASTASGFGFTGIIGYGYMMGLSGSWFIFGILFGSLFAFGAISRRLRTFSHRTKSVSYTEFLTSDLGKSRPYFLGLLGVISIVALLLYASAQLTAGSKAMHVLLGWDYSYGIVIGAVIVLLYCFAGGIRASIWTDAAQIVVMYGAMTILAVVSINEIGGFSALFDKLEAIDPKLVTLLPTENPYGPFLFILGWFSLGFSFLGFPHTMARFMALKSPKDTKRAIMWFEGSYALFYITAYVVALCTRVLLPDAAGFDKELALPELAQDMLPDILVGVIFAGIFAATISTADSLILSCTASLSRDIRIFDRYKESYRFLKICTLLVTAIASIIAIYASKSVFDMVLLAITVMACGFTPLLILRCFKVQTHPAVLLATIITGLGVGIGWRITGQNAYIYEAFPGIVAAFIVFFIGYFAQKLLFKKSIT